MANHRCAVLSRPIAYSLSPVLHNTAYRSLKLDNRLYDRHEVGENDLDAFLKSPDSTQAGLGLAMPLKKTIQPCGVPENLWARELKVTNTTVFDWSVAADDPAWPNNKPNIKLCNTDIIGIQLAFGHANRKLDEHHTASRNGATLIIDNGNTATSALATCCMMSEISHIVVAARHPGKNTGLRPVAEKFVSVHNPHSEIELGDDQALLGAARSTTYVISTIPGHAADNAVDALANTRTEPFSGLLLDVIYGPHPTKLIRTWRTHGGHTIGGEEMLLYRALVQALLVTGIQDDDPSSDADQRLQDTATGDDQLKIAMRKALREAL